ncbi:hypothetical protein V8C37DRAFT_307871 [Trichoderma ceciliae]
MAWISMFEYLFNQKACFESETTFWRSHMLVWNYYYHYYHYYHFSDSDVYMHHANSLHGLVQTCLPLLTSVNLAGSAQRTTNSLQLVAVLRSMYTPKGRDQRSIRKKKWPVPYGFGSTVHLEITHTANESRMPPVASYGVHVEIFPHDGESAWLARCSGHSFYNRYVGCAASEKERREQRASQAGFFTVSRRCPCSGLLCGIVDIVGSWRTDAVRDYKYSVQAFVAESSGGCLFGVRVVQCPLEPRCRLTLLLPCTAVTTCTW